MRKSVDDLVKRLTPPKSAHQQLIEKINALAGINETQKKQLFEIIARVAPPSILPLIELQKIQLYCDLAYIFEMNGVASNHAGKLHAVFEHADKTFNPH